MAEFERRFAERVGAAEGVATSSCTTSLFLAAPDDLPFPGVPRGQFENDMEPGPLSEDRSPVAERNNFV